MSVTLETSVGKLKVELFCESAPLASENFLALCASGALNGTVFHRNVPGFVIQGGKLKDKRLRKSIFGDYFADEMSDDLKMDKRGMLGTARKGQTPNTNGSQFFISYAALPSLDKQCSVFGKCIGFLDTLDLMEKHSHSHITILKCIVHSNPIALKRLVDS